MNVIIKAILIGAGATVAMDIWSYILSLFNITSLDYRFVGRWIGNFPSGTFYHDKIMSAPKVKNEWVIGITSHYLIGITFAFLLWGVYGKPWFDKPEFLPAVLIGIVTIVAPFFLMQPAFGLGVAGAKVPEPNILRLKSFMAHLIYGIGLYLTAVLINYFLSKFESL